MKRWSMWRNRDRREGLALVAVLWLVVMLTVMVTVMGKSARLDNRVTLSSCEQLRCRWACRAALETAIGLLKDDTRAGDGLGDLWSDNTEDCEDVALEGCTFTVTVVDESGKLNVNTATKEQLLALPEMTDDVAEAILDWRDGDDTVRPRGAEGGAYNNLQPGYVIRNGPLRTIRELLLVKGVTEELFYGEDVNRNGRLDDNERDGELRWPSDDGDEELDKGWIDFLTCYSYTMNKDAEGTARTNINSADEATLQQSLGLTKGQAKWIVENRKDNYKSIADLIDQGSPKEAPKQDEESDSPVKLDLATFKQIADQITVADEEHQTGLVNVNTAEREVLAALLEDDESLAEQIVQGRSGQGAAMTSVGELLDMEGVGLKGFKKLASLVTTRTEVFGVTCTVRSERAAARYQAEGVVDRGREPTPVIYWHEGVNY